MTRGIWEALFDYSSKGEISLEDIHYVTDT